jgi:glucosamine 6-phosphate synthetase-like amidotransferase/phosphosugar isomerase protein
MNRDKYNNPLREQIFTIGELSEEQTAICFNDILLSSLISAEDIEGKIILTGCGDSYAAAGSMLGSLQRACLIDQVEVMDPMQFSRNTSREYLWSYNGKCPLVIVISASGGAPRIVEILQKAAFVGAKTVFITNKEVSPAAEIADSLFFLNTRDKGNTPGLRSYFASMVGIAALACKIGILNGKLPVTSLDKWATAIKKYAYAYDGEIRNRIDNQAFHIAQSFRKYRQVELIADYSSLYSALFVLEKFYECKGILTNCTNSEDWCHINIFLNNPKEIGTIFIIGSGSGSYSRLHDTVVAANMVGRPLFIITDTTKGDFPFDVEVCVVPKADHEFAWVFDMMNFIPGSLVASYCAVMEGLDFFRGSYNVKKGKFEMKEDAAKIFSIANDNNKIVVCG